MEYTQTLIKDIPVDDWNYEAWYKVKELKEKFPSKDLVKKEKYKSPFDGKIEEVTILRIERRFEYNKKLRVIEDCGWGLIFNGSWLAENLPGFWDEWNEITLENAIKLQEKIKEAIEWAKKADSKIDKLIL